MQSIEAEIDRLNDVRKEALSKPKKPLTTERRISSLLKSKCLFGGKKLFTIPDSKTWTSESKALAYTSFLLRAKTIKKNLEQLLSLHRCDDDFFTPFKISHVVEDLTGLVRRADGAKKSQLHDRLKAQTIKAVSALISELELLKNEALKDAVGLHDLFRSESLEIERDIVTCLQGIGSDEPQYMRSVYESRGKSMRLSAIVDRLSKLYPESKVLDALQPSSMLFSENFLLIDFADLGDRPWLDQVVRLNEASIRWNRENFANSMNLFNLEKIEVPRAQLSEISLSKREKDEIEGLIRLYKENKVKNLSFLFYGMSGTGKTSLAHAIAKELDLQIVSISPDGIKEQALPHVISFIVSKYNKKRIMILFDECEGIWYNGMSLFFKSGRENSERGSMKKILEKIPGVFAYTSNVEPPDAFRRRVSYVLEMKTPSEGIRAKILEKEISNFSSDTGISAAISACDLNMLSDKYELPGGLYRQALILGAAICAGELTTSSIEYGLKTVTASKLPTDGIRQATITLESLILSQNQLWELDRIVNFSKSHFDKPDPDPLMPKGVTVLLEGPSGTGKTALAEAIAKKLGLRFRRVTPSTFLSKWVGDTEKRIKALLREAADQRYLIFLDEAEGMLMERESARNSWEKTQVDEWLNSLEQFNGIFVAATNHKEMMDAAFARRFLFKIAFDYPSAAERFRYLCSHLGDRFSDDFLNLVGNRHLLSFGELRNVIVQLKTHKEWSNDVLEQIIASQEQSRSGHATRRLGI